MLACHDFWGYLVFDLDKLSINYPETQDGTRTVNNLVSDRALILIAKFADHFLKSNFKNWRT